MQAVRALALQGVDAITGDCGFMMCLQPLARRITTVPVFMSALVCSRLSKVAYTFRTVPDAALDWSDPT